MRANAQIRAGWEILQFTYVTRPVELLPAQERYISEGVFNTIFVQGVDLSTTTECLAEFYTDFTIERGFGSDNRYTAFLTVNNLFDKDPPILPQNQAHLIPESNFALYDNIGRYGTVGLRFKY